MADELIENAEYRRKRKDEEDPILVAQRFLNIYRQMHIFNRERQEQFDDMLMTMSPEVRILLSTLPGGGLLLEHISEIEQEKGVISTTPLKQIASRKKENNSDTPIPFPVVHDEHHHEMVIDGTFATELSSSLSMALQQTEKRYKEDIKTLTENITHSIMESQTAMISMMRDILIATKNSNSMNTEKNTTNTSGVQIYNPQKDTENAPVAPVETQAKAPENKPAAPVETQAKASENKPAAPVETQAKAPETKPAAPVQAQAKAPENKPAAPVQAQAKAPENKPAAPVQAQAKAPENKPVAPVQAQAKAPENKPAAPVQAQAKAPENKPIAPVQAQAKAPETKPVANTYKSELSQIKSAIQGNINTFSKQEPVSLDDFDELPISLDNFDDDFSFKNEQENNSSVAATKNIPTNNNDDEWEWEYVDDSNSDEWEWEYVEDDGNQ